jgi:putative addiction module component (TIGR02574 family)
MKKVNLAISQLTFAQKLGLMEALWEELTHDEKKLRSPAWHEAVLKDREEAFSAGKVTVSDWDQAKKRIKKKVSCV